MIPPVEKTSPLQAVALSPFQFSVLEPPAAINVGTAEIVDVTGKPTTTSSVSTAVALPGPVHVNV